MPRSVAVALACLALGVQAAPLPEKSPAFSHEGLYRLMQAEFALSRNLAGEALAPYREEALATDDPGVLDRALQIANFLQDNMTGLEIATRLSRLQPGESRVWYQLAFHALRQQRPEVAMEALDHLLTLNPEAELEALFLGTAPNGGGGANRDALLPALEYLERKYPDNPHLLFARALLAGENNRLGEAIDYGRRAHRGNPDSIPTLLLYARLLGLNRQEKEALDLLSSAVLKYPESRQVNLHYARMLIKAGHPFQAESRLRQMVDKYPTDGELLLMHGLLAFNNRHDAEGAPSLRRLLLQGEHEDEARYYLALMERRKGNTEDALELLAGIEPGPQYLAALNETADLLAASGKLAEARQKLAAARTAQPGLAVTLTVVEAEILNKNRLHDEALLLLDEAISAHPRENILLFSRALTADKLKNLPQFEKDMQELLARDPENASYLNALGYTLADRTQRFGEAEVYLRQAYRLKPDDPAIIDSMGWLQYRLGNVTEALEYVRKAYTLLQDEEIGLHLAELLWATGDREEAARVWRQLLQRNPDSEMVLKHKAKFEQTP